MYKLCGEAIVEYCRHRIRLMSRGFSVKTQFLLAVGPLIKGSLTSTFQQLSYSKASQYHVEISTFKGAIVSMPSLYKPSVNW